MKIEERDGKRATAILLTINLLRRRLRDRELVTYRDELAFYAKSFGLTIENLNAMATLELRPVTWK